MAKNQNPAPVTAQEGRFYGRFTLAGKTNFVPLDTTLLEIACTRFAEKKAAVESNRRSARSVKEGRSKMLDLLVLHRTSVNQRAGIVEATCKRSLNTIAYVKKAWPGFAELRPSDILPQRDREMADRAMSQGTGCKPPGARNASSAEPEPKESGIVRSYIWRNRQRNGPLAPDPFHSV